MDYEKYYKVGNDGTYTIHFPNKNGLSLDEIRDIFSRYGNVLSVNISGDINGLRFVRYKTLDEVEACLMDLQNSNDIRILPQKDKFNTQNKRTDKKYTNQGQTRGENSSPQTSCNQFNANSTYNGKFSAAGGKASHNRRNLDNDNRSDHADNFSDNSSSNSKYKPYVNSTRPNTSPNQFTSDRKQFSRQQNFMNNKFIDDKVSNCNQVSQQQETDPQTEPNADKDISHKKIPKLICDSEVKENGDDARSNQLLDKSTKNVSSKVIIIPMQEVIVANIHANYGIHYILHLFEKYDPISATLVKAMSNTDLRYCHIYFKTPQDALAVEEEFDNFVLADRNLIVLRKSQLMDAAK